MSSYAVSALVRKEEHASVLSNRAVNPIVFKGLDDLDVVRKAASEHDIVINAASASHDKSAVAIVQGLAERKRSTGQSVHYIHTSGTSILSDLPVSGKLVDLSIYSDDAHNIYEYEKGRGPYGQRDTDVAVVEAGEELGVPTYIIVPPTIYGRGSGPFSNISQQVPFLIRESMKQQQAVVVGSGEGIWNHVHILDLAPLYTLILDGIFSNSQDIPHGRKGFFFAESGEHTWLEVSQGIANSGFAQGMFTTKSVKSLSLADAAPIIGGNEDLVEIVLASK